jgi:protein MpaA
MLGRSALGRPIIAYELGDRSSQRRLLVFGCIHGTECAGTPIAQKLLALRPHGGADIWVVPDLNPDGYAHGTRQNGRGVDLNRNFPTSWRLSGRSWSPEYSGPRPASEPETRIAERLILRLRPAITVWFHQPADLVRAWGPSIPAARRYAQLVGRPFRRMQWLNGSAPNWQNHRLSGTSSFVVELPAGRLSSTAVTRYARGLVRLASWRPS